ncbi:antA/AntB antirepressor family protein [Bartonella sp. B17]
MNALIEITEQIIEQETVQTVNARELHAFLEVKRDFSNWIKDRINKYDFKEKRDYILTLAKIGERQNVVLKDYALTLDMAKELAMVERNEKGKQARQYFIECERRVKQVSAPQIDYSDPRTIHQALLFLFKNNCSMNFWESFESIASIRFAVMVMRTDSSKRARISPVRLRWFASANSSN